MPSRVVVAAAFGEGEGEDKGEGRRSLAALSRVSCLDQPSQPSPGPPQFTSRQSPVTGRRRNPPVAAPAPAPDPALWDGWEMSTTAAVEWLRRGVGGVVVGGGEYTNRSENSRPVRHREDRKATGKGRLPVCSSACRSCVSIFSSMFSSGGEGRRGRPCAHFAAHGYMGREWGMGRRHDQDPASSILYEKCPWFRPQPDVLLVGERDGLGTAAVVCDATGRKDKIASP